MREIRVQPIFIMSVYQSNESQVNNSYHHRLFKSRLQNLGMVVQEVLGIYNGFEEKSVMIVNPSLEQRELLLRFAREYNQDSILYRDQFNECCLMKLNGDIVYLGKMLAVSAYEASKRDCYTYSPALEQHYITER